MQLLVKSLPIQAHGSNYSVNVYTDGESYSVRPYLNGKPVADGLCVTREVNMQFQAQHGYPMQDHLIEEVTEAIKAGRFAA